jgi:hypothetical protein
MLRSRIVGIASVLDLLEPVSLRCHAASVLRVMASMVPIAMGVAIPSVATLMAVAVEDALAGTSSKTAWTLL